MYAIYIAGKPVQIKNFPSLYSELQQRTVAKWREVGIQLGFEIYELDAISAGQTDDCEANMSKVFEIWKQQSLKQTWNDLIMAVDATGCNPQLCEDLKETYKEGLFKSNEPLNKQLLARFITKILFKIITCVTFGNLLSYLFF